MRLIAAAKCPLLCCCLLATSVGMAIPAENGILAGLMDRGVAVGGNAVIKLPPPTMADGLDAPGQKAALKDVVDANHTLESLVRNSVVAPLVLRISDDKQSAAAKTTGRRVDLWFVVHGDLDRFATEEFFNKHVAQGTEAEQEKASFKGHVLTNEELKTRGIEGLSSDERFFSLSANLFDHVTVRGTGHALQTRTPESVTVAATLDPRFTTDAEFPNQWRGVQRDDMGRLKYGAVQPYSGVGWYMKATKLVEPKGAVLVEAHAAFDEPHGWFNGANLLRSKLPLVVQDGVRKFRRKVQSK